MRVIRCSILLTLSLGAGIGCRKESTAPMRVELVQTGMSSATPSTQAAPWASTSRPNDATVTSSATPSASPLDSAEKPGLARRQLPPDAVIHRATNQSKKQPFILWLHGLGASGTLLRTALQVDRLAERYGFAYATPDGAVDSKRRKFWNASDACCDFDHQGVDHVAALLAILDHAQQQPDIDPQQLYVIGFSNGGFMAHRLACSPDAELAGIASLAGLGPAPTDPCHPPRPLRILEVHGAADVVVRPEGGRLFDDPTHVVHPALRPTVDAWARRNRCSSSAPSARSVDLLSNLPGPETTEFVFPECAAGVELWMLAGAGHLSVNAPTVIDAVVRRLLS